MLAGKGHVRTGDSTAPLHYGCVFALSPSVPHHVESALTEPLETLRLVLEGDAAPAWQQHHCGQVSAVWQPHTWEDIRHHALRIEREAQRGGPFAKEVTSHCLHLIGLDLERGLTPADAPHDVAARARAYIASRPRMPPSLHEVAIHCGVSSEHLSRRFTATYGEAPLQFAQRLRLHEAEDALADSERSIADIAHWLGYADGFSFSKAFRRWTSQSPRAWRQHRRG